MRIRALKGMRVVDSGSVDVGVVEDVDIKRNGSCALIVRGEAHAAMAKTFKEKLGVAGVGKDFFEITQEHISDITQKVHLNKRFEEISNITVLSSQEQQAVRV